MSYLDKDTLTKTPQSQPIPGETQVRNTAGGYTYKLDDFARLRRFLIIGTEGGTYYSSESKLTKENAEVVLRCLKQDGRATVDIIVEVSTQGRAPKNDPAIFALALACTPRYADLGTRTYALGFLSEVCRIGTHLFMFLEFIDNLRGWGKQLREAVANWYEDKHASDLSYQLIKYRQRNGWTHRDALRLSHPKGIDEDHKMLYDFVTKEKWEALSDEKAQDNISSFRYAQVTASPADTALLLESFDLPREALQTEHLNDPEVWKRLLDNGMPMTALIRNLPTMTRHGIFEDAVYIEKVAEQLANEDMIRKARIHPINVLSAMRAYAGGLSIRGSSTWNPVAKIVDALDDTFYKAFGNVERTHKRRLIALDISGSMDMWNVNGMPSLTARDASVAMSLVTLATGDYTEVVAFTSSAGSYNNSIDTVPMSSRQRLDDAITMVSQLRMGGTDCALPMIWAKKNNKTFDAIEVYTDNETWAGQIHPSQALKAYRQATGLDTKLIVVGMTATEFTIADPLDTGMLDVVGFDSAAPQIMGDFIRGEF